MTDKIFDDHGRCLPTDIGSQAHQKTRRYFICEQRQLNYDEIYARLVSTLNLEEGLSLQDFQTRVEKTLADLQADESTRNITSGVYVPFFIPRDADIDDMGVALEDRYLKAVGNAYKLKLPKYEFTNQQKSLAGKLNITTGSRHEVLIEKLNNETVVGVFFPCLTEYSIPGALQKVRQLPEKFLLTGGVDLCAAFIAAPDLLFRKGGYPPMLWCSALNGEKETVGYHFEAYGYNLNFYRRSHLGYVAESWWNGLTVLG